MNEYTVDLFSAFQLIKSRYYFTEVFRDLDNYHLDQETIIQSTENSFSAELFRHMRNIMESENNITRYQDLALDFDVRKDWIDRDIITRRQRSYRPDLVLHYSQTNWDPHYQKIYVEVKTHPTPYVKNDIQKLTNAICRLQFDNSVFISVNSDFNDLCFLIRRIIRAENRRLMGIGIEINWERIHLFHSVTENNGVVFSQPTNFLNILNS